MPQTIANHCSLLPPFHRCIHLCAECVCIEHEVHTLCELHLSGTVKTIEGINAIHLVPRGAMLKNLTGAPDAHEAFSSLTENHVDDHSGMFQREERRNKATQWCHSFLRRFVFSGDSCVVRRPFARSSSTLASMSNCECILGFGSTQEGSSLNALNPGTLVCDVLESVVRPSNL